jgi:hypothetical protein
MPLLRHVEVFVLGPLVRVLVAQSPYASLRIFLKTGWEQVRRLGLKARQFVAAMPQTELAAYMRRARVFVLPSVSEVLGCVGHRGHGDRYPRDRKQCGLHPRHGERWGDWLSRTAGR